MKQFAALFVAMVVGILCLAETACNVFAHVPELPKSLLSAEQTHPRLTILEFSAVWCGSCQYIKPQVEALEKEEGAKLKVVSLDVDAAENKPYAKLYHVTVIPTFIIFNSQGRFVKRIDYAISREQFVSTIHQLENQP